MGTLKHLWATRSQEGQALPGADDWIDGVQVSPQWKLIIAHDVDPQGNAREAAYRASPRSKALASGAPKPMCFEPGRFSDCRVGLTAGGVRGNGSRINSDVA
jgi:hypothetical protein